ncbi:MAG: Rrf2 family transcriptional regulator [Fidelibacterota bacterium]|nr:MAG: Rrf2 family transcriptional regulator [Candidatus Neomarinimicrobiota bacterium]
MLKLTRKTEYALMALGHLSRDENGATTKVREIAVTYDIPFPVLAKVMQRMARKGFVEPVQGAQGGYRLKTDLADVNLWQFLERMEGPLGLVDCVSEDECTQLSSCNIKTPMRVIDHTLKAVFTGLTLEHVIRPYAAMRGAA